MDRVRRYSLGGVIVIGCTALLLLGSIGCASTAGRSKNQLALSPAEFESAIRTRVPQLTAPLTRAPYVVPEAVLKKAKKRVYAAPLGPPRVHALVRFLSAEAPDGLGLTYAWEATGNATATLERGSGNCVALASVLVGLGRGLGWPIFYAEARTKQPETQEFDEVRSLSDHMAVMIVSRTVKMIVDFTGLLSEAYSVRPIDDLTAYAHIINNVSAQAVMRLGDEIDPAAWETAISGFELATKIQPELGRAWNNKGIALSKLGRFDEARLAYQRAVELDTVFGSAERNLTMMETRALGEIQVLENETTEP